MAFTTEHHDGFVQNLADGSDLASHETSAARASLRWLPSTGTTVDLILNWQHDTPAGIPFKSAVIPTSRGDTDPFTVADLNRGSALGLKRTIRGTTLLARHTLTPAWSLDSITAWRQFDAHEELDGDGARVELIEGYDDNHAHQFSQELRLACEDRGRFAGFVGLNYSREHGDQCIGITTDERITWPFLSGEFRNNLLAAGVPAALASAAVPEVAPFTPQATLPPSFALFATVPPLARLAALAGAPLNPAHFDHYRDSSAFDAVDAFADGTWRATERLEVTVGARVSFEHAISGYEAAASTTPSPLGLLFNTAPNFAFAPTPGLLTDSRHVAGWAAVRSRYVFNPRISAYVGVSRGHRPPTTIIQSSYRARNAEESILNFEAGVKGRAWSDRLSWEAAVFDYRYRHFETQIIDPSNRAHFVLTDAGRATGRGAELAVRLALARGLGAFATYGYTDATIDRTGENGQPQLYAGSTFRLTARHTAALGLAWEVSTAHAGRFTLAPRWEYKSGHFFEDDNALAGGTLHQAGFSLLHLRAAWRTIDGRWETAVRIDNVFDKKFLIDGGNLGAAFNIPTFTRAAPRMIAVDVTRTF